MTAEQILTMADSYADGLRAGAAGEPISLCPHAPQNPEGYPWRVGWLEATAARREDDGTFDHTPEEYARVLARPELAHLRPDPAAELLAGDTDEVCIDGQWGPRSRARTVQGIVYLAHPPGQPPGWQQIGVTVSPIQMAHLQELVDQVCQTVTDIVGAVAAAVDAIWTSTLGPWGEELRGILVGALEQMPSEVAAPRCPRHGLELRGGSCQRCNRDRARQHHGSRGRR